MKFSELRPLLLKEERIIFRIYSEGNKIIDSGAVVLMNLGNQIDSADVELVYVAACIQHIDLKVTNEAFEQTNWDEVFGKPVYTERTPQFPDSF